jgi:diguanylate cyclase (GGDEF)-like protein
MVSPFAMLDARLRRLPDALLFAVALTMIAGMAALGPLPDRGLPLDDFFIIPVAAVGWLAHRRWYGYATAVVAAAESVWMAMRGPGAGAVETAALAGAARLSLYVIVLLVLAAMRRMQQAQEAEARTDVLTGAANARAFRQIAVAEVERSQRYQHELSLAYLDIDDFKRINDHWGHAAGDRALGRMSRVMHEVVRSVDTVARLGGDEFAILMPETGPPEARALIERLCQGLEDTGSEAGPVGPCSIGLVTFVRPPASLEELIDAGDRLMYRAKRRGKGRVEQDVRAGSFEDARPPGPTLWSAREPGDEDRQAHA